MVGFGSRILAGPGSWILAVRGLGFWRDEKDRGGAVGCMLAVGWEGKMEISVQIA